MKIPGVRVKSSTCPTAPGSDLSPVGQQGQAGGSAEGAG